MIDEALRSELTELLHNASLTRVEKLSREMGVRPLVDAYVRESFGADSMEQLSAAELKELLYFIAAFVDMVKRRHE